VTHLQRYQSIDYTKNMNSSRYTRRVLTHGARGERGAWGVLVGAGGRRGEGGGKGPVGYIAVYVNIGPQSMDYINMIMIFR